MSWIALGCLAAALVGLLARLVGIGWRPWIVLATGSLYLVGFAPIAIALFAVAGNPVGLIVAVAVLLVVLTVHSGFYRRARVTVDGPRLTVLSTNLLIGRADAGFLIDLCRRERVHVVLAQELTHDAVQWWQAAGIDSLFGHNFLRSLPGGEGTGIWSAFPLTAPVTHDGFGFEVLSAQVRLPDGSRPVVYSVHLEPPWPRPAAAWLRELPLLAGLLHDRSGSGPVIAGGDFNATFDHTQFRRLLRRGYRDAGLRYARGPMLTWPTGRFARPLLGLDHLLLRSAQAASIRSVTVPGSDHRALVAEIVLEPTGPTEVQRPTA